MLPLATAFYHVGKDSQTGELSKPFIIDIMHHAGANDAASAKEITLPVQAGSGNGLRLVVFIQDPKSGHVLGVTEQKL